MRTQHWKPCCIRRLRAALACLLALASTATPALATQPAQSLTRPYGVFLSCDVSQMERFAGYHTVVIDAAYFAASDIQTLHTAGQTVYTYLNIGSLERFRPYYDAFVGSTLAPYENWPDERWMDVSDTAWQAYLCDTLAREYLDKGVDGFFIDNCDVYYLYPTEAIFNGLTAVLRKLTATGKAVIVNGGDMYVTAYAERFGTIGDILTGVNQESVFSRIDFERRTLGRASAEDHAYFTAYVERVASLGGQVYLLEYTKDAALIRDIETYCEEKGFVFYVSGSIELS